MNPRFLLLLGPSGCGKSTIIKQLRDLDTRYTYISPRVTRDLRPGEKDKIHVSEAEMDAMQAQGELLVVNTIYGIRYATPRAPILDAFVANDFPVLDWPVDKISVMVNAFGLSRLYIVYVAPPNLCELKRRLDLDGRDADGQRFDAGRAEWLQYKNGEFDKLIHLKIISEENQIEDLARFIHKSYLRDPTVG